MECLLCKSTEFVMYESSTVQLEETKDPDSCSYNKFAQGQVESIYCAKCRAMYYIKERGWVIENHRNSGLYWDEEKQSLEYKPKQRDTTRSMKKTNPLKGIPPEVLMELMEEHKRKNEPTSM